MKNHIVKAKTHYCDPTRLCRRPGSATQVADKVWSGRRLVWSGRRLRRLFRLFWVADLVGSISTCTDFFVGSQTSLVGSGRVAVVEFRNDPTKHEYDIDGPLFSLLIYYHFTFWWRRPITFDVTCCYMSKKWRLSLIHIWRCRRRG